MRSAPPLVLALSEQREALRPGSCLGAQHGGLDENGVNHPWDFMALGKRSAALRLCSRLGAMREGADGSGATHRQSVRGCAFPGHGPASVAWWSKRGPAILWLALVSSLWLSRFLMKSEATINNRAKRHLAGGLSPREVSRRRAEHRRATYWGCEAPQPKGAILLKI
jgi:hypothetical protein